LLSVPPALEPRKLPADPLVLVSDTSTEAERLIACLRARGFRVRDVPWLLLAGRVEAQQPGLVVCDGDAPKLVETIKRVRTGSHGQNVEILLLGGNVEDLTAPLSGALDELPSRQFERPIDVYSILQAIEERIGSPEHRQPLTTGVSMAALPRLQSSASVPRHDSAHPHLSSPLPPHRSSGPATSLRVSPLRIGPSENAVGPRSNTNQPGPLEESGPQQPAPQFPVAHVSRELETLLENAEQKLGNSGSSLQAPASVQEHLSPEAELNAILPPDVLAALDEPLQSDDADDASSPGTYPGERMRSRSAAPSGPPLDKDTGRIPSRPGGTFATVGTGSGGSPGHVTIATATPVPTSNSSFVPMPSFSPSTSTNISFGESLPPVTLPQALPRIDSTLEQDTDAPVATMIPQRRRTEAEAAAGEVTPHPSVEPEDLISTAPPMAPSARLPPALKELYEPSMPILSQSARTGSDLSDRNTTRPAPAALPLPPPVPTPSIPSALGRGDVLRALAELIRSRFSGAFAVEDEQGVRRVVLREGDFVVVASGIEGESLVAFLIQRGDLNAEASRLERKLPQFGRHAGAALIAHGHLMQDELWPVLRAHAEWLLGRTLAVESGSVNLETELPPRLQAEPAVFGGTTGAEVLIETVRRVISPEQALINLGGPRGRLATGPSRQLLNECALEGHESTIVEQSAGKTVQEILTQAGTNDFAAALQALVALGILTVLTPSSKDKADVQIPARDAFDDAAIRSRIETRRALVDEGDYFAFLGVDREATGYQLRHAYLDLRREFEPSRLLTAATADLRSDVDVILEVLDEAYEVLREPTRRERYRRALAADPQ
jgi:hypothetical protein